MCHNPQRSGRRAFLASLPAAALMVGLAPVRARAGADVVDLPAPGPGDTCPVCGMFVAKYSDWVATLVWTDGTAVHFDGAKDFFKYLFDMEKYALGRTEGLPAQAVGDHHVVADGHPEHGASSWS